MVNYALDYRNARRRRPKGIAVLTAIIAFSPAAYAQNGIDSREAPVLKVERDQLSDTSVIGGEVSASMLREGFSPAEDDFGGEGYSIGGEVRFRRTKGSTRVNLALGSVYRFFDDPGRQEQWRNRIEGALRQRVANDWYIGADGEVSTNNSTVEARSSDQLEVRSLLEYNGGPHRLRFRGGWNWRRYDDGLSTKSDGVVAAADYRYRIRRGQFAGADVRYEKIDSETVARYSYSRLVGRAQFTHPLAKETSLRAATSLSWLDFANRPINPGSTVTREDFIVTPELSIEHQFNIGAFLQARTQYLIRSSTDPDFDPDSNRIAVTMGYRF